MQTMTFPKNSASYTSLSYDSWIVGAVLFDWNGLPQEYFVDSQRTTIPWEQAVFQVLGLRWLLMSSLRLEGFSYAKVACQGYVAFIIRKRENYVALLLDRDSQSCTDLAFMEWLYRFDVTDLRNHPRFGLG